MDASRARLNYQNDWGKNKYATNPEHKERVLKDQRSRYTNDPEYRQKAIERTRKRKARNNAVIAEFRSGGCLKCDEKDYSCLHAHHRDPKEKDMSISDMTSTSVEKLTKELAKCVCLCANCHAKLHAGKIELEGEKNEKFVNRLEYMFALV